MTATTSARVAVRRRLYEYLTEQVVDMTAGAVTYSQPPTPVGNDAIWLGDIKAAESGLEDPRKPGRQVRNDAFTIDIVIVAVTRGDADGQDADARAIELLAAVEDVIAEDVTLGAVPGLLFCKLAPFDGPSPQPTDLGYASIITAPLFCSTQLR